MTEKLDRILVVDDEEAVRRLLNKRLSDEGYQCQEASNAEQALYILRNDTVSLVVLDIRMPGKSGIELLPEIKDSFQNIAVVMATATIDISVAVQCMKQGAYDYVTKPFDLDDVAISVGRALEKRMLELQIKEYQQHLEEKVAEQAKKIRASFLSAVTALAYALEAKDKYTSGHSLRVADISSAIAGKMGLPQDIIEKIKLAASVHDIGKIGIREIVLNKPADLTDEEFEHIRQHPEIGEHILAPIAEDEEILKIVRNHHGRYDGTGYPDRLQGHQIPLGARILAVADAYEAMTSERPYRKAMSDEAACTEIKRNRGSQFDPEVADIFLRNKDGLELLSVCAGRRERNGQ